jgi:hypothetical protein
MGEFAYSVTHFMVRAEGPSVGYQAMIPPRSKNRKRVRPNGYARMKVWIAKNPERFRTLKAASRKRTGSDAAIVARRRAAQRSATPRWANQKDISSLYRLAKRFGVQVDHIVPLVSDIVCGLHCTENLQLMQKVDNQSKSNVWWPDMP